MANAGPNTGGSQFFITLAATMLARREARDLRAGHERAGRRREDRPGAEGRPGPAPHRREDQRGPRRLSGAVAPRPGLQTAYSYSIRSFGRNTSSTVVTAPAAIPKAGAMRQYLQEAAEVDRDVDRVRVLEPDRRDRDQVEQVHEATRARHRSSSGRTPASGGRGIGAPRARRTGRPAPRGRRSGPACPLRSR